VEDADQVAPNDHGDAEQLQLMDTEAILLRLGDQTSASKQSRGMMPVIP